MNIEISEGIDIPPRGKINSKRSQIVHALRSMRSEESMLVTIPDRTPRSIQTIVRVIASQVKIKINTRTEETGCRIWVRFQDEQRQ